MAAMISAVTAAVMITNVVAHGWIEVPLARQFCNGNEAEVSSGLRKLETKVSGGNGANGLDPPYGGIPNLCGDPFEGKPGSRFWELPCEPQETYQQGGIIQMQIDVGANHGGFWEVGVCDSADISQECFDRNKLTTVAHGVEQYWMLERRVDDPSTNNPDHYYVDWQLPPNLSCDHCVVQWTWWTAHNCLAMECTDGEEVCGFYADRKSFLPHPGATWDMKMCDSKYPKLGEQPQIFQNCADIKIVGNGEPPAPVPPEPPVEMLPPPIVDMPVPSFAEGEYVVCIEASNKTFGPIEEAAITITKGGVCSLAERAGGFDGYPSRRVGDGREVGLDLAIEEMFPGDRNTQNSFLGDVIDIAQPINLDFPKDVDRADAGERMNNIRKLNDACTGLITVSCGGGAAAPVDTVKGPMSVDEELEIAPPAAPTAAQTPPMSVSALAAWITRFSTE